MKLEIALLLSCMSVISAWRPLENCRRRCGYSIDYVCSTSGVTYDNECMLQCDWAVKQCDGRCPCQGQAYIQYPVFRGFAMPMPFHVPYHVPDYSTPDCVCPKDKDYVCTTDNETYDNSCEAACDRKLVACDGRCPCKY